MASSLAQSWDGFYARFGVKFYKDRHWLRREVMELMPDSVRASPLTWCPPLGSRDDCAMVADDPPTAAELETCVVGLEAGCGCGSAAFPLLRANDDLFVLACDFSTEAVALLKERDEYKAQLCVSLFLMTSRRHSKRRRIYAWAWDVATDAPE